jgi:hypothetical protein
LNRFGILKKSLSISRADFLIGNAYGNSMTDKFRAGDTRLMVKMYGNMYFM